MWRISNEDGPDSGIRNIGRLALMLGFFFLAMGSSVWLGIYLQAHRFIKELSQEDRRAVFVGAYQRPHAKVRIETPEKTCLKVTHVDLDGVHVAAYVQNNCGKKILYNFKMHYQTVAPDGTLLDGSWKEGATASISPEMLSPGEQGEFVFDYATESDNRTAALRLWFESEGFEPK